MIKVAVKSSHLNFDNNKQKVYMSVCVCECGNLKRLGWKFHLQKEKKKEICYSGKFIQIDMEHSEEKRGIRECS